MFVVGLFSGCDSKNIVTTSDDSSYVEEYKECKETVNSSAEVSSNLAEKDDMFVPENIKNLTEKVMGSLEQLKSIESENSREETIMSDNATTRKEVSTTTKSKESTTTKKTTTTTKKAATTTYKPTTTKPSITKKPTTTKPTTKQSNKILYYYEDGTTGYELKPGARCKANGVWLVVSWGTDLTDEEIKEAHKLIVTVHGIKSI